MKGTPRKPVSKTNIERCEDFFREKFENIDASKLDAHTSKELVKEAAEQAQ